MRTIINITNQQELDSNVQDCKKLQKQIQKLQKKLNNSIQEYNNKSYSISICTLEYKDLLPTIK
jgi:DNA-binding protein YbaB